MVALAEAIEYHCGRKREGEVSASPELLAQIIVRHHNDEEFYRAHPKKSDGARRSIPQAHLDRGILIAELFLRVHPLAAPSAAREKGSP